MQVAGVLICDFHREQAWDRWIKKSENQVGKHKPMVVSLLRNVAKAPCEKSLLEAINALTKSQPWTENEKLQNYFNREWLTDKEVGDVADPSGL